MPYFMWVTLDTGGRQRSERDDQHPAAIAAAGQILRSALYRPQVATVTADMLAENPEMADAMNLALDALHPARLGPQRELREWTLRAGAEGKALLCTICAPPAQKSAPVITFGVALTSRSGAGLWRALHEEMPGRGPVATDPEQPPPAPWIGSRMEIGCALIAPEQRALLPMLADLSGCIAWAWYDRVHAAAD